MIGGIIRSRKCIEKRKYSKTRKSRLRIKKTIYQTMLVASRGLPCPLFRGLPSWECLNKVLKGVSCETRPNWRINPCSLTARRIRRTAPATAQPATAQPATPQPLHPELKDSVAERPYHSNFSDQRSVKILSEFGWYRLPREAEVFADFSKLQSQL